MGGFVAALVALLLGALGLYVARASRDPGTGPTAATLDDAFFAGAAALFGLLVIGVAASLVVWPKWPTSVGAATVVLGYALAWMLDFAVFDSYDDAGEMIAAGVFFSPGVFVFGVIAGIAGSRVGRWRYPAET